MKGRLVLGTVQFGLDYGINNSLGKPSTETSFEIINYALDKGISTIDTAIAYGSSQEVIGKFNHSFPNRRANIISKFEPGIRSDSLEESLKDICENTNTESLYAVMFHRFDDYLHYRDKTEELEKLKDSKLTLKLGVSVYSNEELLSITQDGLCDIIQIPFNMLDNNSKRKEAILKARESGIEIHTRSAFFQGLFFVPPEKLDVQFSGIKPAIKQIQSLAKYYKIELGEMALNYALHQEHIDGVVIGVDSKEQLKKNIEWAENSSFSTELSRLIDEIDIEDINILNPSNWS